MNLEDELDKPLESMDDTPLKFGKYKGETPEWVARNDPQYLIWFCESVEGAEHMVSLELYNSCVDGYF